MDDGPVRVGLLQRLRSSGDEGRRQRARWAQVTGKPFEEAFCRGCRSESDAISLFGRTDPCAVWVCIGEKGHEHRCDCAGFPCENLQPYADAAAAVLHNTKVFHLALIKRLGLDRWARKRANAVREAYFAASFGSRSGTCGS